MAERIQPYRYYFDQPDKWGGGSFGTAGGVVTWSLATGNYDGRDPFTASLVNQSFPAETLVARAFRTWSGVADIQFRQVADGPDVDIRMGMSPIDGVFDTLAYAQADYEWYADRNEYNIGLADITFDTADFYDYPGVYGEFYATVLHEIGHAIGLHHEDSLAAVMNSDFSYGTFYALLPDDVRGIQSIYGIAQDLVHWGSPFDDRLTGSAYAETLNGLGGNDILVAGPAADSLYGHEGDDLAYGNRGDDRLFGGAGDDRLFGGPARDWIYGGIGEDRMFGNGGTDRLFGQGGNDHLRGGAGDDLVVGNRGHDTLHGEAGNDRLVGGPGLDHFVMQAGSGIDTIIDFMPGRDTLALRSNLNGSGLTTTRDVITALSRDGDGVVLTLGGGNEVHLLGLRVVDLSQTDFEIY